MTGISELEFAADDRIKIDKLMKQIKNNVAQERITPVERLRITEQFKIPDRALMWLSSMEHNSRAIGATIREILKDPKKAILADLATLAKYGCDTVTCYADPHIIGTEEIGSKIIYPEDSTAIFKEFLVKEPRDISKLEIPDPYKDGKIPKVLQIIKFLHDKIGEEVVVWQNLTGPFGYAGDLRGYSEIMKDFILHPESVHELMEFCTDVAITITKAVKDAGATVTIPFDAMAAPEFVGKEFYMKFIFPYEKKTCQTLKPLGTYFAIDGDTTEIIEEYASMGAKGIFLQPPTDFSKGKKLIGGKVVLCASMTKGGGEMASGTPEEIKNIVKKTIKIVAPNGGSIIGSGVIPVNCSYENVMAFVEAVEKHGKYPIRL